MSVNYYQIQLVRITEPAYKSRNGKVRIDFQLVNGPNGEGEQGWWTIARNDPCVRNKKLSEQLMFLDFNDRAFALTAKTGSGKYGRYYPVEMVICKEPQEKLVRIYNTRCREFNKKMRGNFIETNNVWLNVLGDLREMYEATEEANRMKQHIMKQQELARSIFNEDPVPLDPLLRDMLYKGKKDD